jgi:hypothetical protein
MKTSPFGGDLCAALQRRYRGMMESETVLAMGRSAAVLPMAQRYFLF